MIDAMVSKYGFKNPLRDLFVCESYSVIEKLTEDVDDYIEDVLMDLFMEEESYEGYEIVREEDYVESAGEEIYNFYWFNKRVLIKNESFGKLFLCDFGGQVGEYGEYDYSELEGDITYIDFNDDVKEFIEEFLKDENEEKERLRLELLEFRTKIKEDKKLKNEKLKKLRNMFTTELLNGGFTQCKSKLGNPINQFEISFFIYDSMSFSDINVLLKHIEDNGTSVNPLVLSYILDSKITVRLKLDRSCNLSVVKKYTSKGLNFYGDLYADLLTCKVNEIDYYGYLHSDSIETYEKSNSFIDFTKTLLYLEKEKERKRNEGFRDLLNSFF